MNALIIGGAGFVGHHLIECLQGVGWEVCATCLPTEKINTTVHTERLDISDAKAISRIIAKIKPQIIFHLAAQSSVALSWQQPQFTVEVNVIGTLNLLEALKKIKDPPKLLLIGSSEEYGRALDGSPTVESTSLAPTNVYAVTKVAQGMLGQVYARAFGLNIITTRSFNHIGPGQHESFVVSSFCKQIATIEAGHLPPILRVGNLNVSRDMVDVRDVVFAYKLLAENGVTGETYNVGAGSTICLNDLLNQLLKMTNIPIEVVQDPNKIRPADVEIIIANVEKLRQATDWVPRYTLLQTLRDVLNYWRSRIEKEIQ